ncbi:pimeloyl-ACP methyl ester carboxylesterase [Crossiella equi]|uniref:Pimeloyl-ACP methyl ester carboxylesterase n=1 Tax=Crossiella equi TaxID=130796 RepID=A0ABS5APQ5_9PSEU|nr:alpha/beta hydrolase [Crossiella equi]MBP2478232.1 pimeloyl-ACP methyl ester carboxylesterase [Crossiella equi]
MPRSTANGHLNPGTGLVERVHTLPDGRRLRLVVAGRGPGPLVVFEAGLSAPAASWVHTQREVSAHTRTLSYDRAGYGGSDPDPHPRTLERLADDLTAVLDLVGETEPVVLVGHSWGGPILRLFADRHPDRVAGLVFVDASLAEAMPARNARLARRLFQVLSVVARFGGGNMIMRISLPHGLSPEISESDVDIMRRDHTSVRAMRAAAQEAAQILTALPVLRRLQAAGTPPVPTVCLQGGRADRGAAETRRVLNRVAAELMAAVPHGEVVVAEDAGHLVPQESPGIARDTILRVVEAVRARP